VIHLDTDPWELGKNYPATVAIQGDPKATLPELSEALRHRTTPAGHPHAAQRREAVRAAHDARRRDLVRRAEADAAHTPMPALTLLHEVARALPDDAVVIDEAISSAPGLRELLRCNDAKSFYGLRGGGIGWGLPATLGVKLALPGRPVVGLIGDGSAMYTSQALWTAARDAIAAVIVIVNNRAYRILKQRTRALKGFSAEDDRYVAMDLDPAIDFIGLARSLGVRGERVEKSVDVGPALGRALASGGPYLVDVRVDGTL
jgi:benzoylformate decarboxylase